MNNSYKYNIFESEIVTNAFFSSKYEMPILAPSFSKPLKAIPLIK